MRKQRGFTLIELLIVVAIIGIIAAIAIPNLLDAIERSRQKRSIADLKSLAGAIQTFSTDYGGYPNDGHNGAIDVAAGGGLAAVWNDAAGSPVFVPDYIQALPVGDGWKTPYQYTACAPIAGAVANVQLGETISAHYVISSFGNDAAPSVGVEPATTPCADYPTWTASWCVTPPLVALSPNVGANNESHCYATDIIWADSAFGQVAEGKQKNC